MFLLWWAAGLFFSLVIGGLVTPKLLDWLRDKIRNKAKQIENIEEKEFDDFNGIEYFSRLVTGTIERLFFTILVGFNISGTATAMIVWITVKMSTNWLVVIRDDNKSWKRQLAFSALLGNMISLFFALIGGLIFSKGVCK